MKILKLISINRYILLVFHTPDSGYQFSLLTPNGFFYQSQNLFCTYQQAEREARSAIQIASSFFDGYCRQYSRDFL